MYSKHMRKPHAFLSREAPYLTDLLSRYDEEFSSPALTFHLFIVLDFNMSSYLIKLF